MKDKFEVCQKFTQNVPKEDRKIYKFMRIRKSKWKNASF